MIVKMTLAILVIQEFQRFDANRLGKQLQLKKSGLYFFRRVEFIKSSRKCRVLIRTDLLVAVGAIVSQRIPSIPKPRKSLIWIFAFLQGCIRKQQVEIFHFSCDSTKLAASKEVFLVLPDFGRNLFADEIHKAFECEKSTKQRLDSEVIAANIRMINRRRSQCALGCTP